MTRDLGSERGSSISPRLESKPSGNYIDLRFPRQASHIYHPSISDGYNSEDYIDMCFPGEQETDHIENLVEKLHELQVKSGAVDSEQRANTAADHAPRIGMQLFTADFKEMRFPRVSEGTLRVDVEDFYTALTVGLDSLKGLADSAFLTAELLQQSVNLLQTLDSDVRILVEKLADLRHRSSVEFCQALIEYSSISGKILEVCNALKFSTTLLKAYESSQVEASVAALESLVSLPKSALRAVHVAKAEEAGQCLDSAEAEMIQMQAQVKKLVESGNYGSLSYFVPNLCPDHFTESDFGKWSGLWGVLFAMKTTTSYISQLLLAGLAHAGEGPVMILASTNTPSFNSGWASSLVALHIHVRKQFNIMQDSRNSCSFMSRDDDRLEFMLKDTKGHLQSLLDQGKFLNIGVYLGSWQADKKKLMHNVPRLRQHLLLVRYRLSNLCRSIESLASNMSDGQQYLAQI